MRLKFCIGGNAAWAVGVKFQKPTGQGRGDGIFKQSGGGVPFCPAGGNLKTGETIKNIDKEWTL